MTYADFESILVTENMESKIQKIIIFKNIKNILLAGMIVKQCVLIANLLRSLSHTQVKTLFKILLIVFSKKENIVLTRRTNILTKNL